MQQDQGAVQAEGELPTIRRVPFGSGETDISKLIVGKYLGIPYVHRGRTMAGLDCWGLLKLVYADLGFRLFDLEDLQYGRNWAKSGDYFKEHSGNDWEKVDTPRTLDGVLFVNSRGIAYHAGIVLDDERFIHCCRAGVVIARRSDWAGKVDGFYRLKGLAW